MITGTLFILILAMVAFLLIGFFMTIDAEYHLVSWKVPYTLFSLAGICIIAIIGIKIWSWTGRTYKMHDVTIRVYYFDGSQKLLHLEQIPQDLPRIDSRSSKPYLVTGKGNIPYIDRFDIVEERCYEMKGSDFK